MTTEKTRNKGGKANRLANETSTYLLQHAYNPVDWYPWGEEALHKAKAEEKPILLSVGYSACHWCHVMEHESFEDEDTAALMNKFFVNIKVDREERPDIDEIYMKAVQMLTGHGGWPMTVFLTPDLKPFFGGTYFPPEDRHGLPSFKRLLLGVQKAWEDQRESVLESSEEITEHLAQLDTVQAKPGALTEEILEHACDSFVQMLDRQWGGFGGAPKFPHAAVTNLLMRQIHGNRSPQSKKDEYLEAVTITLDRMAYGGMHDQVGGGLARYSVDRYWLVPHFEKMLYDNALLCRNYFDGYLLSGRRYWREIGRDILEFILREMTTPEGGFYSSLDADSEGEEGKFYVWKPDQIISVLGEKDGSWVNEIYGVKPGGNFEHGTSVLHLKKSPEETAADQGISEEEFWQRLNPLRKKLLEEREKRVRPGRDDKVLTSWNSLMISGFVDGYRVLQEDKYLAAARNAAAFILEKLKSGDKLLRTYGRGKARLNAYLDDYAYLVQALLDLASVDFDPRWYEAAVELNISMLKHFWDDQEQTFFYTSADHEVLIARTKNFFDGSIPSATSVAVANLLRLARLQGEPSFADRAESVMSVYAPYMVKAPTQFAQMLCALDLYFSEPSEVALLAAPLPETWKEPLFKIHSHFLPNTVVLVKAVNGTTSSAIEASPLIQNRGLINEKPTVYICRNFTCDRPVTDLAELETKLAALS